MIDQSKNNLIFDSDCDRKTEKLECKQEVYTSAINQLSRMQPTLPQTAGAADMDLTAVQSMDWLFKKERIYLLAQFWQQRATLAEKEVNTLKEQLSGANLPSAITTASASLSSPTAGSAAVTVSSSPSPTETINLTTNTTTTTTTGSLLPNKIGTISLSNNNTSNNSKTNSSSIAISQQHLQNGLPSSPSPPLSDCGSTAGSSISTGGCLNLNNLSNNNKLLLNNIKMEDASSMITTMTADMKIGEHTSNNDQKLLNNNNNSNNNNNNNNNNSNSNNNNNSSNNLSINSNNNRSVTPNDKDIDSTSFCNNNNNTTSNNNSSTRSLVEELAAKDKEIKTLIGEVTRLQVLQETHIVQIQRLEERLEAKRQHILRLEARLEKQLDLDDDKKENSNLRSLDMSSPAVAAAAAAAAVATDAKQFQELLLERTKALAAAQNEALKSNSSSDGSPLSPLLEPSKSSSLITSPTVTTIATDKVNTNKISEKSNTTVSNNDKIESPTVTSNTKNNNHNDNSSIDLKRETSSPPPTNSTTSSCSSSSSQNIASSSSINVDNDINPEMTTKQHRNTINSISDLNNTTTNHVFNSSDALFKKPPRDNLNSPSNKSMVQHFQNIEQFGATFLDDDILNDWCRSSVVGGGGGNVGNFEFHPPSAPSTPQPLSSMMTCVANALPSSTRPSTAPSTTSLLSQLVNSTFPNSLLTDTSVNSAVNSHHDIDKASSHHETSSTASTPNLQDARSAGDEHLNGSNSCMGGGSNIASGTSGTSNNMTSMSLSMTKGEDNNNTLGPLPHVSAGFLPALPFQFQEHGRFRFAEDLQMPPGTMAGRLGDSLIPKGDPMEAKLQEMLRYNMDKYANQNLDTLHISRRVRELLSVHNIGQRLFAKYILGLSQGTVSELLSKPKPWDKLTEKGRDSYRKMHAWACDDNAVLLLKSLIPKKGKDSGMPQYGRSDESVAEDRIAHILSEASSLMKTPPGHGPPPSSSSSSQHHLPHHQSPLQQPQQQHPSPHHHHHHQHHHHQQQQQQQQQQQSHQQSSSAGSHTEDTHSNEDSKSPHHNQCPSPFYKDSMQRRMKNNDNDDLSQDKVARIYQEELAKLMSRSPREAGFPSGGMPPSAMSQMQDDNIRMALEAYHRELAKLQQTGGAIPNFPNLPSLLALQQHALNGAQDLSVPKEKSVKINGQQNSSSSSSSIDQHDQNTKESNASEDALRHSSAFSLVRPKQDTPVGGPPTSSSTPVNPTSAAPSPLSNSILPPAMTPTDDFSAAASPLQRMASITNSLITQAPVSSHHATPQRPMKAILPPITQQQFDMFNNLNTEDIVRRVKEALSQYSISQRLFGESVLGLSQGSVSDLLARPKPWHMLTQKGREPFIRMKMFLEDDNAVHRLVASQYKIAPEKLMRTGNYSGSPQIPTSIGNKMIPMQKMMSDLKMDPPHILQMQSPAMSHIPTSQHQGMLLTPPGMPPHHAISLPNPVEKKPMMMPVHSPQQSNAMRNMHQHMSPTVYEMAALTHDLDTQVITTKIKEALLANNIGQKIFGEAVLGLSQGSVSELLSKPKPWHMLSIKGREPFIRMQLWLSDANNVERLQAIKNERREASKRRRSTGPGNQDNSSDTSSNDTADFYTNSPGPGSVGSAGAPPNKKQRVLFSEEQKEALRLAFALDPYPNVATIEFLANELGLATRTITNWFHNHRMRLKQQVPHGSSEPVPTRESQSGTPFDPVQFRILLNQRLMELQKERMGLTGVPIPYPPYFAANPNLAALIGRGLLPGGEPDLAALNNAFKEQMSGLDLSMSSLKRERDEDFEDVEGEADSHASDTASIDGSDIKLDFKDTPTSSFPAAALQSRTSRRKPAAPQWVNPDWQDDIKAAAAAVAAAATGGAPLAGANPTGGSASDQEVIINGVCVMQQQAADYSRKSGGEETVRVEPTAVQDRLRNIAHDDDNIASDNDDEDDDVRGETESNFSNKPSDCGEVINENDAENEPQESEPTTVKIKQEDCSEEISSRRNSTKSLENSEQTKEQDDDNEGEWNY